MIYWLDNCDNHQYGINENWGLELFSMGMGNYTEDDVRECSRAFTGVDHLHCPSPELLQQIRLGF